MTRAFLMFRARMVPNAVDEPNGNASGEARSIDRLHGVRYSILAYHLLCQNSLYQYGCISRSAAQSSVEMAEVAFQDVAELGYAAYVTIGEIVVDYEQQEEDGFKRLP